MKMTRAQLIARFPHAKEAFLRANATDEPIHKLEREGYSTPHISRDAPTKKRLRQPRKLNKTEAAFYEYLKSTLPGHWVYSQGITFEVGASCRFTPDFVSVDPLTLLVRGWETKGFMRDDARVKLLTFARSFPWIAVKLVTRRRDGSWDIEGVRA